MVPLGSAFLPLLPPLPLALLFSASSLFTSCACMSFFPFFSFFNPFSLLPVELARDSLLGRVFEISLGDLKNKSEDDAFYKFKLKVADVAGRQLLTNFYGMDITTDKLRSLVRKWHTLIEAFTDVKTTDGYSLRVFAIGFTKRRQNQARKTSYAQSAQTRRIRKKMIDIITREASNVDLNELVQKLMSDVIGKEIEKTTQSIYPLQNVLIRHVKMLSAPKVDLGKLLEIHGGAEAVAAADNGAAMDRAEEEVAVAAEPTEA